MACTVDLRGFIGGFKVIVLIEAFGTTIIAAIKHLAPIIFYFFNDKRVRLSPVNGVSDLYLFLCNLIQFFY